jgi:hypothetical protein
LLEMPPAVAVKFAEIAPAGIVTELEESDSSALLLDRSTSIPPVDAGAAAFSVTVHVAAAPELRLVGLQES